MTNLQLLLSIGVPTVAVLIGIFYNNARFNSVEQRLIVIEGDLRCFNEILGGHGADIETLKKREASPSGGRKIDEKPDP
jgi:hypothetical protein